MWHGSFTIIDYWIDSANFYETAEKFNKEKGEF